MWMRTVQALGLIAGIGLLTGFLTSRGQTYLPGGVSQFANSYAVWLSVSFLVGALLPAPVWALVGGALVQFAALAGYYLTAQLLLDVPPGGAGIVAFWVIGGILGGPALGLAGLWWRRCSGLRALAAAASPGALYLSEGLYLLLALGYDRGYAFLLVGVAHAAGRARRLNRAARSRALALPRGGLQFARVRYRLRPPVRLPDPPLAHSSVRAHTPFRAVARLRLSATLAVPRHAPGVARGGTAVGGGHVGCASRQVKTCAVAPVTNGRGRSTKRLRRRPEDRERPISRRPGTPRSWHLWRRRGGQMGGYNERCRQPREVIGTVAIRVALAGRCLAAPAGEDDGARHPKVCCRSTRPERRRSSDEPPSRCAASASLMYVQ